MSKKKVDKKPVKKIVKPTKAAKPAAKKVVAKSAVKAKAKPTKAAKPGKPKTAAKPSKKAVTKKVTTNIVSKKNVIKKAVKAVKKVAGKPAKPTILKKSKPVSKAAAKSKAVTKTVAKKSIPVTKEKTQKLDPKKAKTDKPVVLIKSVKTKPEAKNAAKDLVSKTLKKGKEKDLEKDEPIKAIKSDAPKAEKTKPRRSKKKKSKDDDDEPAIENDPLIEEIIRSTKKRYQQPKKPKIIQTFVNPMASLAVALPTETGKKSTVPKKEPKGKFELEYVIRTSASILYEFLTSPSGLSEWFADDVNIRDGIFTFYWDGSEQKARLLNFKDEKFVRMQWVDKPEGTYFEFKIEKDELTGDISLIIIDFADEGSDLETSKRLWDSQVNKLLHVIGSY
jgi:uncharacterized protein YndB with AHSA1/START domain